MEQTSSYKNKENTWFVLYTSYYRYADVVKILKQNSIEYFLPMHTEIIVCREKEIKKRVPSIPGTIYVKTTEKIIKNFTSSYFSVGIRTIRIGNVIEPLTISDDKMQHAIEIYRKNGEDISCAEIAKILH